MSSVLLFLLSVTSSLIPLVSLVSTRRKRGQKNGPFKIIHFRMHPTGRVSNDSIIFKVRLKK
jgi:hypothetical protein